MVLSLAVTVSPLHMLAMEFLLTVHLFRTSSSRSGRRCCSCSAFRPRWQAAFATPGSSARDSPFARAAALAAKYTIWHFLPVRRGPQPAGLPARASSTRRTSSPGSSSGGASGRTRRTCCRRARAPATSSPRSSSPRPSGWSSPSSRGPSTASTWTRPSALCGLSRLTDQQLGGMTMAAEQSIIFFARVRVLVPALPVRAGAARRVIGRVSCGSARSARASTLRQGARSSGDRAADF